MLLFGQSGFRATNPDASVLIRNVNDEDLLGVAEMQLGVDWRRCIGSGRTVFATAALEAQYWINAGTGAPMNNAPFDEGNYQNALPQDADLGFFGGSFGLGLLF